LSLNSFVLLKMKSVSETSGIETSGYGPRKIILGFQISNFRSDEKVEPRQGCRWTAGTDACAPTKERPVYTIADQMAVKLYIVAALVAQTSVCD
jgi:hypothetical protein